MNARAQLLWCPGSGILRDLGPVSEENILESANLGDVTKRNEEKILQRAFLLHFGNIGKYLVCASWIPIAGRRSVPSWKRLFCRAPNEGGRKNRSGIRNTGWSTTFAVKVLGKHMHIAKTPCLPFQDSFAPGMPNDRTIKPVEQWPRVRAKAEVTLEAGRTISAVFNVTTIASQNARNVTKHLRQPVKQAHIHFLNVHATAAVLAAVQCKLLVRE